MLNSKISKELKLQHNPVAIIFTDELPEKVKELKSSKESHGCSLSALRDAAKGETVYLNKETPGCNGMKAGMGFVDDIKIPGGREYFLSCGRGEGFPEGEKLKKTPEVAKSYYDGLPKEVMNNEYVIFKPLEGSDEDNISLVTFLVNPDQLSALITLHAYDTGSTDTAYMPMASGCSTIVKLPLAEMKKDNPRAIIGLADIWARPLFDGNILAFTVSYKQYKRMESYANDCFFQAKTWNGVKNRLV
ncbi:DUF169 domain-containing protein [Dethiothermospora halolimnae]|uniref:DUF169 domain-containing protein n=1 Tax=Dethiothermospora halolimnae TaxID=3114390 RepID=UPI003CCBDE4B